MTHPDAGALLKRLRHAMTTMQNDDRSEPLSEKRDRHVTRYETLADISDFLERQAASQGSAGGERSAVQSDEALAEEIHRVAGCHVSSERCKNIIKWYRSKSVGAAQAQTRCGAYKVSLCDDGQWIVHTDGDVIAHPGQGDEEAKAHMICAALNEAWQPIETAPKDGLSILLGWAGSSASEGFWHNGSKNHWKLAGFYFSDDDLLTAKPCSPTHWMHLPQGPAIPSADREAGK